MEKKIHSIFLVDDDIDDRELFCEALADVNAKISIDTAEDGIDALSKLQERQTLPDLIFLDLNMPRMDGKQFLKKIKGTDLLSNIPVIVYTTSSNEEDKKTMLAMGAGGFIVKPNSYSALCQAIKDATNS